MAAGLRQRGRPAASHHCRQPSSYSRESRQRTVTSAGASRPARAPPSLAARAGAPYTPKDSGSEQAATSAG